MSRTLRWILYGLLGLVVVALVAGALFVIFGRTGYGMMGSPGVPWDGHMRFYNFSPLRILFGGLLCLGIVLLIILGVVALVTALVRGNRPLSAPPVAPIAAPTATPDRPCSNCGRMTQEDWKTCPYCGNPLT